MWLFSHGTNPCTTPVCDPCSVSICEEIKRVRANRVRSVVVQRNCRVCGPSNPGSPSEQSHDLPRNCRVCGPNDVALPTVCQPELIGTYTICTEETSRDSESSNQVATCFGKDVKFQPPPGCCDKLSFKGIVWAVRNEIATFQLTQGVSCEEYGFVDLLKDLIFRVHSIGMTVFYLTRSCLSHVLTVTISMIYLFMYVIRFTLDKILGITMEESLKKKLALLTIFAIELFIIVIILEYITSTLNSPIQFMIKSLLQLLM